MKTAKTTKVSGTDERVTFDHLPRILSSLQRDVNELKVFILEGNKIPLISDEWLDIKGLCSYHPNHPSSKTVYHWVHINRIPYHKDVKHIRFKRSEIDDWLSGGYHRTEEELLDDTVDILNSKWKGLI